MHTPFALGPDFEGRFCYWTGASGRRYIHSVYAAGDCPPLPGAIFLKVVPGPSRSKRAVELGRFAPFWAGSRSAHDAAGAEIHVHLLAEGEVEAAAVLADLAAGLGLEAHAFQTRAHRAAGLEMQGRAAVAA